MATVPAGLLFSMPLYLSGSAGILGGFLAGEKTLGGTGIITAGFERGPRLSLVGAYGWVPQGGGPPSTLAEWQPQTSTSVEAAWMVGDTVAQVGPDLQWQRWDWGDDVYWRSGMAIGSRVQIRTQRPGPVAGVEGGIGFGWSENQGCVGADDFDDQHESCENPITGPRLWTRITWGPGVVTGAQLSIPDLSAFLTVGFALDTRGHRAH